MAKMPEYGSSLTIHELIHQSLGPTTDYEYFCDNPKCPQHIKVNPSILKMKKELKSPFYSPSVLVQYVWIGHKKYTRFVEVTEVSGYFCDVCSAAIDAVFSWS